MSSTNIYHGSCHRGSIKYQIRLTFPPIPDPTALSIRLYKCNCTTCQKMGYFHCRPISCSDDFILTSPSTIEELGDYRCNEKKNWLVFLQNMWRAHVRFGRGMGAGGVEC
ncbi:hypothetical protein K469DRAFT_704220 [Zopfia rhizophila CBS 207.26]|uniref:CENP-V/GFA domain-containing protein n=1 Tax=Zopfia rhizophila CBS 207.26 TaxID=1314779 RepID=A0A6A6ECS4_9PEZI|nr:hypothetical protein K469DRAFT_704220 [Zopfia rhizophila CBS 207.26]